MTDQRTVSMRLEGDAMPTEGQRADDGMTQSNASGGEVSASFVPPSTTRAVVAECPLCLWRSAEVSVRDEVNAQWHARQEAATQYRDHFDVHRPLPRFVRIEAT